MSAGDWKDMFKGVQENDLSLVKYYLSEGINPNYQHPEFMALPLAEAIRYDLLEMVKLLLANGADPLIKEMESGLTCLELANSMKDQSLIDLLNDYN